MASNFLEQLVAEWYEYRGYFVRRNAHVGPRAKGGYECELDVIALHPEKKHLVHVEASTDASTWDERERRFAKKFEAGRKYLRPLFRGLDLPGEIEQIAVLVFGSMKNRSTLAGARMLLAADLLREITEGLRSTDIRSSMVPEQYPLLRTVQFVVQHRSTVLTGLDYRRDG